MPRKEKKYHFIYKTVNILTNRYYLGMHSTNELEDGYLGSGKRLRYSIRKYGAENHQRKILEFCNSRKELSEREKELVTLNEIAKEDCINLVVGGEGGFSEEIQLKGAKAGGLAIKLKIKNDIELYKQYQKYGIDAMKKLRASGKSVVPSFEGRTHSEESKRNIGKSNSVNQKGSGNSQYGTCWITNETENKKIKKEDLELWESKGYTKGRKHK